jgi:DNA-binding CsgD family transcriptional regulator/alkylhydroperoxidase/carboxymuconolactone decarboxylase family protein YurZ
MMITCLRGSTDVADKTQALQIRLATEHRSSGHGASSVTTAELRLLPMLATHLSGPEIAAELFLSPHTVKSQQVSLYRKLGVSSRGQAVVRARELGLLEGEPPHDSSHPGDGTRVGVSSNGGLTSAGDHMSQTARSQETLRKLAMIGEAFVEDQAGLGLGQTGEQALDPKTAALLQLGASVAIGSPAVCIKWNTRRALAAGATDDEIADVLLAIAPVAGLSRAVCAASGVATALGYDIATPLDDSGDH